MVIVGQCGLVWVSVRYCELWRTFFSSMSVSAVFCWLVWGLCGVLRGSAYECWLVQDSADSCR